MADCFFVIIIVFKGRFYAPHFCTVNSSVASFILSCSSLSSTSFMTLAAFIRSKKRVFSEKVKKSVKNLQFLTCLALNDRQTAGHKLAKHLKRDFLHCCAWFGKHKKLKESKYLIDIQVNDKCYVSAD